MPENIILALIREKSLPLSDTLTKIPYIHSGYVSIIAPSGKEEDGE